MTFTAEEFQRQIPYYLTQDQKTGLLNALNAFPSCNYYTTLYPSDVLQGDGWTSIQILRFNDGARDNIKGILLSNSCDITPENERVLPPKITFAPLVRLNDYIKILQSKEVAQQKIEGHLISIRAQRVTSIFYLPKGGALDEEHIALLGDLHTIPFPVFMSEKHRTKLFTLSQVGFYMFLMKLSIHFCRFHENLAR